jgi:hypothetical protein
LREHISKSVLASLNEPTYIQVTAPIANMKKSVRAIVPSPTSKLQDETIYNFTLHSACMRNLPQAEGCLKTKCSGECLDL